jgi:hypothetical protein
MCGHESMIKAPVGRTLTKEETERKAGVLPRQIVQL